MTTENVHALEGLACRARVAPASSPILRCLEVTGLVCVCCRTYIHERRDSVLGFPHHIFDSYTGQDKYPMHMVWGGVFGGRRQYLEVRAHKMNGCMFCLKRY